MKKWKIIHQISDKGSSASGNKSKDSLSHHAKSKVFLPRRRKSDAQRLFNDPNHSSAAQLILPSFNSTIIKGKHSPPDDSEGERRLRTEIEDMFTVSNFDPCTFNSKQIQMSTERSTSRRFARKSFQLQRTKTERKSKEGNEQQLRLERKQVAPALARMRKKIRELQMQHQILKNTTSIQIQTFQNALLEAQKKATQFKESEPAKLQPSGLPDRQIRDIMQQYGRYNEKMFELDEQKQVFLHKLMRQAPR